MVAKHKALASSRRGWHKESPVDAAIAPAYQLLIERLTQLSQTQPLTLEVLTKIRNLLQILGELISFAIVPLWVKSGDRVELELNAAAQIYAELGYTPTKVAEFLQMGRKRPKGHPVENRHVAATGLGMKLQNPDLTWQEITRQICPCGKSNHDNACRKTLKRNVERLRNLLRKIEDPAALELR